MIGLDEPIRNIVNCLIHKDLNEKNTQKCHFKQVKLLYQKMYWFQMKKKTNSTNNPLTRPTPQMSASLDGVP